MKKLLTFAAILAITLSAAFASDSNSITAGFGFGMGGSFVKMNDADADVRKIVAYDVNSFDFLDIEGRLFLNSSNMAFLFGVNGGVGGFQDERVSDSYDAVANVTIYAGVGYRFKPVKNISVVPSFVLAISEIEADSETTILGKTIESSVSFTAVSAGADVALIWHAGKSVAIEASCLFTASITGEGESETSISSTKTTFDLDSGDVSVHPKLSILWLF